MTSEKKVTAKDLSDQFHVWIGLCITEWALVDDWIFQSFKLCVFPLKQAAILYYRTPGLDIRLNMTDEIIRSVVPQPERKSGGHQHALTKDWTKLKAEIGDLLSIRRRIAHHPVEISQNWLRLMLSGKSVSEHVEEGTEPEHWFMLYASQHERLREREADMQPLTINDLRYHLATVHSLVPRLVIFQTNLSEARASGLLRLDAQWGTGK